MPKDPSTKSPVKFDTFKREVFRKIGERGRNSLFYWSLFDPSTWEESGAPDNLPNISRGQNRALRTLKEKSIFLRNQLSSPRKIEIFKNRFLYGEFLANYLLAAEIESKMKLERLRGTLDISNLERATFPDILITGTRIGRVSIEIKGNASGKNLTDRLKDEVLPHVVKAKQGYKNLLLLLLFPACRGEVGERVEQLIGGYYVYEDKLMEPLGVRSNRKVLCKCIEETGNKYTLNKLSDKVISYIKNHDQRRR